MNDLGIVLPSPGALRGWADQTSAVFQIQGDLTMKGKFFNNLR